MYIYIYIYMCVCVCIYIYTCLYIYILYNAIWVDLCGEGGGLPRRAFSPAVSHLLHAPPLGIPQAIKGLVVMSADLERLGPTDQPFARSICICTTPDLYIYIYIYRSRPSPRYPLPGHVMSADLEGLGPTTRAHDQPFARSISICITPDLVYIYIYIPHAPPLCIPSRQSRASWSCRRTSRGSA